MKLWIVSAFVFSFLPVVSNADVLKLENGDIITGSIVSFKDGLCVFSTPYGSSLRISAEEIKDLVVNDKYVITLNNGDRMTGYLKGGGDGKANLTNGDSVSSFKFSAIKDFSIVRENKTILSKVEKEKEEYSSPINYLSDYTVLLNPGEVDLDFGFKYRTYKTSALLPQQGPYQVSSYSIKTLYFYLTPRFGITKDVSVWFNVPWTYTRIDDVSSNSYTRHASQGHIGDLSAAVQYKLLNETVSHPSVTASISVNAPTGRKKYVAPLDSWKQPLNNTEGYWSITPSLSFVRITDPVTLFGGVSYEKTFETNKGGQKIKYGDIITLNIGSGYSLNDVTSFGTQFQYSWSDNLKYEGQDMKGTSSEGEVLQFYFSYLLDSKLTITPEVSFPLDSSGATVGVGFSRGF